MASLIKNLVLSMMPRKSVIYRSRSSKVYLTFDDGPHRVNTPKLLDLLRDLNVKATFFVQGENAIKYPEIAKRIVTEGHTIAGHSYTHRRLPLFSFRQSWQEYKTTHDVINATTQVNTKLYRPPYGWLTVPMLIYAVLGRIKLVLWSVDSDDDSSRSVERILQKARSVRSGDIILCHDDNDAILEALPQMLNEWRTQGLQPSALNDDDWSK
jgi:peptidoglycan/xylan/chitin deacetylase (PgdA/CDA1 family)